MATERADDRAGDDEGAFVANGPEGQSQHVRVAGWLRDRIIEGALKPGDRIPEVATCQKLGISRTPLREAFKVLAVERILTLQPNRGAIVTPVSAGDVDHAMVMMSALEGLAGELLCAHVTDDEVVALGVLTAELGTHQKAGDLLGYFKVNQEIHRRIMVGARNPVLSEMLSNLIHRFARYRFDGNRTPERWARAVLEHEHMMIAIAERDAALLGALLRAHVGNGWRVARGKSFPDTSQL